MMKESCWVANRGARQGLCLVEEEGSGRFADGSYDDDFQEKVADAIVEHEGGLMLGAGGTGKSEIIKRIKKKFEETGFWDPPNKKTHKANAA